MKPSGFNSVFSYCPTTGQQLRLGFAHKVQLGEKFFGWSLRGFVNIYLNPYLQGGCRVQEIGFTVVPKILASPIG